MRPTSRWVSWFFGATIALLTTQKLPAASPAKARAEKKQVIAYVFPKDHVLTADEVPANKLTRVNYAFANIKGGEIIEGFASDAANYKLLTSLRHTNPSLQILASVGGWGWSGNFSDMALTPASRRRFIDSVVRFVTRYQLDGLDIDWEYPGLKGAGNTFRPEDKANYTALLRELRARFNQEERAVGRHLLTSVATGANADFLEHTEMGAVARYVDTVNLMTYDFYGPDEDKITGNHAPLHTDPADPKGISAERSVQAYEAAGVPAGKLVLGVPFYGKSWSEVDPRNNGLFSSGSAPKETFHGYSSLVGLEDHGYTRHWDAVASVPWLYNAESKTFITYEDPESLALKGRFVLDRHLAGVMFWELSEDSGGALLNAIETSLQQPVATGSTSFHADSR